MLELNNIIKIYSSGDSDVTALDGVSIKFEKNEFVSILGPSGCGKTTLLNIVGGLDRYTNGDLIINNKSTKMFSDRDWDTYRNHSIGFVFQSYNLISHQTILSNVEMALTLSGVNKKERKKRAEEALKSVGLESQMKKKPNQLSGGQMQRVAIARALVNNPDIILADEPTGALDSETSIQIMNLLKEVAKTRLVIMVTHNPDLAYQYSTRIIKLKDGKVISDEKVNCNSDTQEDNKHTDYNINVVLDKDKNVSGTSITKASVHKNKTARQTSMSFKTALSLSFKNLLTKKARTILTSFAGSIGIIGIALILSLSDGFQNYISTIEKDTLSTYPITLEKVSVDLSSIFLSMTGDNSQSADHKDDDDNVYPNQVLESMLNTIVSGSRTNDLKSFKSYLDNHEAISKYVSSIEYNYGTNINIYKQNTYEALNPFLISELFSGIPGLDTSMFEAMNGSIEIWSQLLNNETLLSSQYDFVTKDSHWPKKYNEVVLVLNEDNTINDYSLYALGLKSKNDITKLFFASLNEETFPNETFQTMFSMSKQEFLDSQEQIKYSYNELMNLKFNLLADSQYYVKENNLFVDKSSDTSFIKKQLVNNSIEIEICGIVKPKENVTGKAITTPIGYSNLLVQKIIDINSSSEVVNAQLASKDISIFTGEKIDQTEYDAILNKIGYRQIDTPESIMIYPNSFESKEEIVKIIDEFNADREESQKIQYTDYVGLMMSSITTIINSVSYVLIAFVAISLIVSSIMIGIITYISVLERTKEIGILRSIGASKKDISRVFNAEALIIGFSSGVLGVLMAVLIDIPINIIINALAGIGNIAQVPVLGGIILVAISCFLTFIAGLLPSSIAAKKDPVVALRSE